jgi:hypothetical protein
VRSFIVAGATHLILNLAAPYPEGIVQRLADEVASPLRAEHEGGYSRKWSQKGAVPMMRFSALLLVLMRV